jgi:signal transduction histidine kinase
VTIRKTLLAAFVGLGVGTSILLTALAFVKAREALRAEIDRNVGSDAGALAAAVDRMMFERVQNAAIWSHLDVMQDIGIRDIDKRLSQFLADLERGYGDVYTSLSCTDASGQIVASSDAARVGTTPAPAPPWLSASLSGETITLARAREGGRSEVLIEVPVASSATAGNIGTLRLAFDWSEIESLFDRAERDTGRAVVLLDRDGEAIGASRTLRDAQRERPDAFRDWRHLDGRVGERAGAPAFDGNVIVGGARTPGYAQFPGFGWSVLVMQPVAEALAPVHRMALVFLLLLALIAALTALIALWISQAIARPIANLTALARDYVRTRVLNAPPSAGVGEVGELADAFVGMVRDIDLSQKKLVRASKLAVVGEMSSVIAHEVRTPLGIMRSSAQVLAQEPGISAEGRELAGFIGSETERLNRLVSAMLDSARPRAPVFIDVDMHELLRRAVSLLASQLAARGIGVRLALGARDPHVEGDEEQLTQVALNILMNALQVLDAGGNIDVVTRDEGDQLAIDIADDGPGIAPHERAHVFDAFFFKREGGIGLGLAIVQQIVQAHGGTVEAAESESAGALFQIRMPRTRREPT